MSVGTLGGANLFAYCGNNPVMGYDPSGMWGLDWFRSRWFISNTINVILGFLVGGGITKIAGFFKNLSGKYGVAYAATHCSQTVKNALLAKGIASTIANWVANGINYVFAMLMVALDPGGVIFDWIDARDRYPRNGYLDF